MSTQPQFSTSQILPPSTAAQPAVAQRAQASAPPNHSAAEMPAEVAASGAWADYWLTTIAPAWLTSAVLHMVVFIAAALLLGDIIHDHRDNNVATFEAAESESFDQQKLERFELGDPQIDPSELSTESLMDFKYEPVAQEAEYNDDSPDFEKRGGGIHSADTSLGGLGLSIEATGLGPAANDEGGLAGGGQGKNAGKGGEGIGFGHRGIGKREGLAGGGTKQTERAVATALNWLARHQRSNGNWTIDGGERADIAATALGLLPFLAAGQTHDTKGPYQKNIRAAIAYLLSNQKADGDLSRGGSRQMYEHGLATIALCEVYGMAKQQRIGYSAQAAIKFIERAQNAQGGWRYQARSPETDASVVGWQIMALKSGQMAGLEVNPYVLAKAKEGLKPLRSGYKEGKFAYTAGKDAKPSTTAIGLLCLQYMGARRNDPAVREGIEYLMEHQPAENKRDIYYWYYATQVLHNAQGQEWETWNRRTRRVLVETQTRLGPDEGSWNPDSDEWGLAGGRLMVTSLSCLTLEVYYRYLPLYKLNDTDEFDKSPEKNAQPLADQRGA